MLNHSRCDEDKVQSEGRVLGVEHVMEGGQLKRQSPNDCFIDSSSLSRYIMVSLLMSLASKGRCLTMSKRI